MPVSGVGESHCSIAPDGGGVLSFEDAVNDPQPSISDAISSESTIATSLFNQVTPRSIFAISLRLSLSLKALANLRALSGVKDDSFTVTLLLV